MPKGISSLIVFACLCVVAWMGDQVGIFTLPTFPNAPWSQPASQARHSEAEIICGRDIVLVNAKGEASPHSNEIDEKIAKTAFAYSREYKTDLCKIRQGQFELTPLGWTRKTWDRRGWYINREFSPEEKDAAELIVRRLNDNPDLSWKATQIIRAPRKNSGDQTKEEIDEIRGTMDMVPKKKIIDPKTGKEISDPAEGHAEFYIPRQQGKQNEKPK